MQKANKVNFWGGKEGRRGRGEEMKGDEGRRGQET